MKRQVIEKLLFTALCLSQLVICPWQGLAQSQKDKDSRGPDPIVDIGKAQPDQAPWEIRAKRDKRHNLPGGQPVREPRSDDVEEGIINDRHEAIPAFPIAQSDAIVIATVTKAAAHLSEDRAMVYSEFDLNVTDILKTAGDVLLRVGESIEVERIGGAVRFPSGRMWRFRIYQQGFPHVGGTYTLFLKYNAQTQDFYLVTGYELKKSMVVPLDGVGFTSNPKARLASFKYNGADPNVFLGELRTAINGGLR